MVFARKTAVSVHRVFSPQRLANYLKSNNVCSDFEFSNMCTIYSQFAKSQVHASDWIFAWFQTLCECNGRSAFWLKIIHSLPGNIARKCANSDFFFGPPNYKSIHVKPVKLRLFSFASLTQLFFELNIKLEFATSRIVCQILSLTGAWLIIVCIGIQKVTVPSIQNFSIPTRHRIPHFSPKVRRRVLKINFRIIPKIMLLYQNHFSELYNRLTSDFQIRWGQVRSLMVLKVCTHTYFT